VAVGCEGQELLFRAVLALKHASKQALKTAQKNAPKNAKSKNYATMAAISSNGLGILSP
jgi:hypothetical protein